MPDKPNENKLMAMLERWGIIQKSGSEDETVEEVSANERPRSDADLRSMFGSSADDPAATPTARQPVPGMINPVLPNTQTPPPRQAEPERPRPQPVMQAEAARSQPMGTPQKQSVFSRGPGGIPDSSPRDEGAFDELAASMVQLPSEKAVENYADRYLEIDEVYEALSIRSKRTDSIYLVEEYLLTLPDSLPDESRREIVAKIVSASGFDYDRLMGDGVLRVKMLKEYAERFAQYTEDYVAARNVELDALDQQIVRIRTLIEGRRELHKKQFFAIEAEAQRLKDIITFISS